MTALYYYPDGKKGKREVWGYIPDKWLETPAVRDLGWSAHEATVPIPYAVPHRPTALGSATAVSIDMPRHYFTVRLELDKDGHPSNRYPRYVLMRFTGDLEDHPLVATYPRAREWSK